jgi:hypothetical protein
MADALLREQERKQDEPVEVLVGVEEHMRSGRKGTVKEKFVLPAEMTHSPNLLDAVVDTMCEYARAEGDKRTLAKGFREYLVRQGFNQTQISFWSNNVNLMFDLVQQRRDTIWGFILRNAYRPVFFAQRKFDYVVGNPPWLAYRFIQDNRYQTAVKELVRHYGLLDSSEFKQFANMDTSTLFFSHCCKRYLAEQGALAFVMPKSVLTGAKQHENFQRFGFTSVMDLEEVTPLFSVPACVLVRSEETMTANVPMKELSGTLPAKNLKWNDAQLRLALRHDTYTPPVAVGGYGYYFDLFTKGPNLSPRCLCFVRPVASEGLRVINPQRPYLETCPNDEAKKPWKEQHLQGAAEAEFLYATLLSKHLLPFGFTKLDLVVLPVRLTNQQGVELVTRETALAQGFPLMAQWLRAYPKNQKML